jgi:dTDP-4-amino-4,6-dideoxygalactose transaminase
MNLDESLLEQALTGRTRAIVPVHYAGVSCEMDTILAFASKHDLLVVEDAAQGLMSSYRGKPLGSMGDMGTLSFHETKNIISGEGGALLVNRQDYAKRAEIIRDKGTNRKAFFRGEVDKYSWVDIGSSFLPSDLIAAYLWAQMEEAESITARRLLLWQTYHEAFEELENEGLLRRPLIPEDCEHNAHMYYILLPDTQIRMRLIDHLKSKGIHSVFHYVPLHSSDMGRRVGRVAGGMERTDDLSARLLRLPIWLGVEIYQAEIVAEIRKTLLKI